MNVASDILGPGGTAYGASNIHDLYFFDPPVDDRFVKLYRRHFNAEAAVNQLNASFKMGASASVYLFNRIFLELELKLENASNGLPPADNAMVAPVNNVMHSVIERVRVSINEVPITTYNEHYAYKAYLNQLIEYNHEVKRTQLRLQGWEDDSVGAFDDSANAGFLVRQSYFVKSAKTVGEQQTLTFRSDPVTFFGVLDTDIQELHQGLIPETPWELHIDFAENRGFPLLAYGSGVNYRLRISDCRIHVWMGLLNEKICSDIQHGLNKKAAKYYFRETACVAYTVRKGCTSFETPMTLLKSPGIKLYVAFVKKTAFDGDQRYNPFDFRRMWKIGPKPTEEQNIYCNDEEDKDEDADYSGDEPFEVDENSEEEEEEMEEWEDHDKSIEAGITAKCTQFFKGLLSGYRGAAIGSAIKGKGKGKNSPAARKIKEDSLRAKLSTKMKRGSIRGAARGIGRGRGGRASRGGRGGTVRAAAAQERGGKRLGGKKQRAAAEEIKNNAELMEGHGPGRRASSLEMPPPSYRSQIPPEIMLEASTSRGRGGKVRSTSSKKSSHSGSFRSDFYSGSGSLSSKSSWPRVSLQKQKENAEKIARLKNFIYPGGDPDPYDNDSLFCYIRNLTLMIDGVSPESYRCPANQWDALFDYANLQTTQSNLGENNSNNIDYPAFLRNYFVGSWNLSNSPNPNSLLQPTVPKSSSVQIRVDFENATPEELVLITWTQMASILTIDSKRNIGLSYYNKYNN
jgi:hypothetical protein